MSHAIYTSLAAGTRSFEGLDVVANNLANADTPGFKAQVALFRVVAPDDAAAEDDPAAQMLAESYLSLDGIGHDMSDGAIVNTGDPAHVALRGEGFLAVQSATGETLYTRDGSLAVNDAGQLIHQSGGLVLSDGGQSIDLGSGGFEIQENGAVLQRGEEIARLKLTVFEDEQTLIREGSNLFSASGESGTAAGEETQVVQGALEQSNVDPMREMVELIRLSRFYQAYSQALQSVDQIEGQLNSRVGKSSGT